ncbi:MAG: YjbQ family protein [Candidatus Omnitrophica bacterium]|nr:YjbQ family protein [Candidatus Omnitrophota bacterium]
MKTKYIEIDTKGNAEIIDITPHLEDMVEKAEILEGILFLSIIGSTAALTTMEFEPGLVEDMTKTFENLFPYKKDYAHNATWSDDNGHSHLRSSFLKTSFFVSVTCGKLDLGRWQQVVLIDFDTRSRQRKVVVKIVQ